MLEVVVNRIRYLGLRVPVMDYVVSVDKTFNPSVIGEPGEKVVMIVVVST